MCFWTFLENINLWISKIKIDKVHVFASINEVCRGCNPTESEDIMICFTLFGNSCDKASIRLIRTQEILSGSEYFDWGSMGRCPTGLDTSLWDLYCDHQLYFHWVGETSCQKLTKQLKVLKIILKCPQLTNIKSQ